MRHIAARLRRYVAELRYASRVSANARTAFRLALATMAFHLSRKQPRQREMATPYVVRLADGERTLWMRTYAGDLFIFYEVFRDRVYHVERLKLPARARILDIGANVGLSTLFFADLCTDAEIFAVEPDAQNYELLARNTAPLGARARTLHAAAAAASGTRHFRAQGAAWAGSLSDTGIPVTAYGMPDLIRHAGWESVDLVKLDVEGAEAEIFRGDLSWLDRVSAITVELHGPLPFTEFRELLESRGFDVFGAPGDREMPTGIARRKR